VLIHCRLLCFKVPCAESRSKFLRYLTVLDRIGFSGDTVIAGIQGVIANLHEKLKVLLLCEIYVCSGAVSQKCSFMYCGCVVIALPFAARGVRKTSSLGAMRTTSPEQSVLRHLVEQA
jgi:hypothetical protein